MSKTSFNNVDFLYKRDYFPREAVSQRTTLFRSFQTNKTYHQKDLRAHFGCVNAIDFSHDGKLMISGGDDRRVLLWNVQESLHLTKNPNPKSMKAQHSSNIFTLAFDSQNKVIFSGGNDDHVILHDMNTGDPLNIYLHERPVYCVSVDPSNDSIFASACDDGRVLLFDTRSKEEAKELAVYSGPFHAVMYNPCEARLVATANNKEGIALWDTRKPKEVLMQYGSCESCMSIRFNKSGTQLLGLRRRLPPVLYNTRSPTAVAQFDHEGYYNSCTMKSCCFAGSEDEYVVSGSDDFVLYMWRVPRDDTYGQWVKSAHHTLEGHRSIVNQVRYNEQNCVLASSGVEKIVKLWSPFPLKAQPQADEESEREKDTASSRKVYTHEDYIRLILHNGETFMNHDYSLQSTNEDPRMMAFFDSLVQREIEGWSPTDESSSDLGGEVPRGVLYYNYVQGSASSSSSSSEVEEAEEELEETLGPEAFRRSTASNSTATHTSTSTSHNSSTSSQNTSSSASNSMILFLTDAALESNDTAGLSERTRTLLADSLATSAAPRPSPGKNPIKELIAQKRDRLMKLAHSTPEKRKKKHLRRLRRKCRYLSDEGTSASGSESDTRSHRTQRYRVLSSEEDTRDASSVDAASTSTGIRRKRKISETETPDSGIASDSKTTMRFTNNVRNKARCYRNLLRVSSSSDEDSD